MRRAFLLAALFTLTGCVAVPPIEDVRPLQEANPSIVRIYDVPGVKRADIYRSVNLWIAESFRSAKAVTEYQDRSTVIGNGIIDYPCTTYCEFQGNWRVPFTMRVDMKDERMRVTFTNINLAIPATYNRTFGVIPAYEGPIKTQNDLDAISPKLIALGDALAAAVTAPKKSDDW